jgi:hypothetical protein
MYISGDDCCLYLVSLLEVGGYNREYNEKIKTGAYEESVG